MENYFKAFDLDYIKQKFNISDETIKAAAFSPEELRVIYDNYVDNLPKLEQYKSEFLSQYILEAKNVHFHSYNGRVKDPDHLIEKVIRKRNNRDGKYAAMTSSDYFKYITDMIGFRILLVYKSEWKQVHDYLTCLFSNNESDYIKEDDYAGSYRKNECRIYMAEKPVVYIRPGDDDSIYTGVDSIAINNKGYYRSVHYIIRFHEYYLEIQVRSLFEEAWGEVDHDVLYPLYKGNKKLVQFSRILNRAAGLGDEISAYFKEYVKQGNFEKSGGLYDTPDSTAAIHQGVPFASVNIHGSDTTTETSPPAESTLEDVTNRILED